MAEVKWIKVTTDIFDDEKILLIEKMPKGDMLIVIWMKLLVLAGKQNNGGSFTLNDSTPYNAEMLSTIFKRPVSTVRQALKIFEDFGMITIDNGVISITNWEKHQNISGMEKVKKQNRDRQKRWYDNQKALPNVIPNVSLTLHNATEEDKDKDKEEDIDFGTCHPALGDVEIYCQKEGLTVNPYAFWKTFEERDWKQDGTPIRNWKAMIKAWDKAKRTVAGKPDEIIMAVLKQMEEQ